ncbi:MAG: FISUMP domain-containing protein [Bacteroidota bacterium]|nr:FISUMP domain-containing protein [Bacteroidota bacterium]
MKTISLFVLSLLLVLSLPCIAAINYSITFTGTGASSTVADVVVQNLTKGTTVTVPAGNILNLSDALSSVDQLNANDETIRIYPNSVEGASTLSFSTKQAGSTQINAYSLAGRKIVSIKQNLQAGSNSFQLSLPCGSYAIQIVKNGYSYTSKIINQRASVSKPAITYIGTEKPLSPAPQKSKSSTTSTTTMTYNTGDRLLYKGTSGNYSTVVTDVPTASKTINFDFTACTDADGNNYSVVKIGTQTWMAENLKTTKYNDGTSIPNVTDNIGWVNLLTPAYCWYNNDSTTYKNIYGALYNWYTVNTAKLAPAGWHVPTDAEWTILGNYLLVNGYNYDGTATGNNYAKSLAATTNWTIYTSTGAIGNDLTKNNSTGFSAAPGGSRFDDNGKFDHLGFNGYWWSSTQLSTRDAWTRFMYYDNSLVDRFYCHNFADGYSVRCLKD